MENKRDYFAVDRIEEGIVVLQDDTGKTTVFRNDCFSQPVREGDIVFRGTDGIFEVDAERTRKAREDVAARLQKLWNR